MVGIEEHCGLDLQGVKNSQLFLISVEGGKCLAQSWSGHWISYSPLQRVNTMPEHSLRPPKAIMWEPLWDFWTVCYTGLSFFLTAQIPCKGYLSLCLVDPFKVLSFSIQDSIYKRDSGVLSSGSKISTHFWNFLPFVYRTDAPSRCKSLGSASVRSKEWPAVIATFWENFN